MSRVEDLERRMLYLECDKVALVERVNTLEAEVARVAACVTELALHTARLATEAKGRQETQ